MFFIECKTRVREKSKLSCTFRSYQTSFEQFFCCRNQTTDITMLLLGHHHYSVNQCEFSNREFK